MLKVAIIGCGKIADSHALQIQRIAGCELVGVCDREELMARQLADRFGVKRHCSDLEKLFTEIRPDVVHITTPPQTHFDLAGQAMRRGCHVYVEKPFTVNTAEARELVRIAQETGRKMTVGHDLQFTHAAMRLRRLVKEGYLGGPAVHMESTYCYDLGEAGYATALLSDKEHWVRKLPGKLLQNVISHGVARIAEHLTTETPEVFAHGFVSPLLRKLGEREIVDELRVTISEEDRATAYFTFSSQMRPAVNQFRIYGPKNGLMLDLDNETVIRLKGKKFKSYAEHFLAPLVFSKQYLGNTSRNVRLFLARDFHMKSSLKHLAEAFYGSITEGAPLPISYREILLTSWIMDQIFEQLGSRTGDAAPGILELHPGLSKAG